MKLSEQIPSFLRYLASGVGAVVCDFGSYFLLTNIFGVWYVTANTVGNILGFFSAFLFHKYFSFRKNDQLTKHFIRYCLLNLFNFFIQTALLWLLVEKAAVDTGSAKVGSWGMTVLWNYFLYKFLVYV